MMLLRTNQKPNKQFSKRLKQKPKPFFDSLNNKKYRFKNLKNWSFNTFEPEKKKKSPKKETNLNHKIRHKFSINLSPFSLQSRKNKLQLPRITQKTNQEKKNTDLQQQRGRKSKRGGRSLYKLRDTEKNWVSI